MSASSKDTLIIELKDTISQLNATISALNLAVNTLNKQHEEDAEKNRILQEQIDYLTKKLFGTSSEKMKEFPGQINFFDEAEQEHKPELPEEVVPVAEHTRKSRITNAEKFKGVPVHEELIELPADEQICPECGAALKVIGKEYVRDEL